MTLADIATGQTVFVDANTFVYAYAPEPNFGPPCFAFLDRVRRSEISAVITSHVLSDVSHRLMSLEACATFAWPYAGIANRLKKHPTQVAQLTKYRQALDEILGLGIRMEPTLQVDIVSAADLSRQFGLLSGDAVIAAIMLRLRITNLSSHDGDFDRIPGIVRFAPL